jgi:DNA-binding transcriptional MerR regulator
MTVTGKPLRSGALAKVAGVSTDTLRFYERRGLLPRPPRDTSGYRRYPPAAADRVRLIQQALDAGFSVRDLARILKERDAGGVPCGQVLRIASERLEELEARIASLSALCDGLRTMIGEWRRRLDATPAGTPARLLEALAAQPADPHIRSLRRQRSIRRTVR